MAAGVPRQPRQPSPAEGEEQRQGKNRHGKNTKTQNPHIIDRFARVTLRARLRSATNCALT